ncbi:RNA polymerase sigma factor [Olivibacter domesticus]|uniref:RNA polymerase sigma-70 factor, ECF subfamily n=1 Tax=Olivibacter domesticus TaxID=407022 RepID=A0A1H7URA9_OLID1|nr:RNA polymerase sigma-70 factor [Olivibacter domesticus]SEL99512.1 RNA polymerase sigma-70 factor, ECF subfamily [Olivibacter domesticus]
MASHEPIDPYLIAQLKLGSEAAFRKIYQQLHLKVYRFIFALLKDSCQSEEILQETFVSLWVNRQHLKGELPLYPYLYLTARRLTIDAFRKASSEQHFKERLQFLQLDSTNETEEQILMSDLQNLTKEAINILPPQQRIIFQLSRIENLSYDEIALQLNISRNTVRNHLVSALKTLRAHFVKHDIILFFIFFLLH